MTTYQRLDGCKEMYCVSIMEAEVQDKVVGRLVSPEASVFSLQTGCPLAASSQGHLSVQLCLFSYKDTSHIILGSYPDSSIFIQSPL